MKDLIPKALQFATEAHLGQLRKVTGEDFVVHPIRVSERVKTDLQKVCALLHDVVEDTPVEIEQIRSEFGHDVAYIVGLLTHRVGDTYEQYIERVLLNENARVIKVADICDNLNDSPSFHYLEKVIKIANKIFKHETN